MTYTPRTGKRRGTQVIDAFGTNWLVVNGRWSGTVEHEDGGWVFGVAERRIEAAVPGQQVCREVRGQ